VISATAWRLDKAKGLAKSGKIINVNLVPVETTGMEVVEAVSLTLLFTELVELSRVEVSPEALAFKTVVSDSSLSTSIPIVVAITERSDVVSAALTVL